MRNTITLLLMLLITQLVAQDSFELVVKGKKQGVKSQASGEWLIPLGKYTIIKPHENLFLEIDYKNQLVQGFYRDKYFSKTTTEAGHHFFGEVDAYQDVLRFEDGRINLYDNSFTTPRFDISSFGLRGPGAGFIDGHLIAATSTDSLGLYNLAISKRKGAIQQFTDVEFCISDNLIIVGKSQPITYDPVYDISYMINEIDVYEIENGKLNMLETIKKSNKDKFGLYYNHLKGYAYDQLKEPVKVDIDQLIASNFQSDSAAKYELIVECDPGILFANKEEKYFLTAEGEWIEILDNFFDRSSYSYEADGHFSIEQIEEQAIITNYVYSREFQVYDEFGEPMYTDVGDAVYQEEEDIQKSGVWDFETAQWIVPDEYMDIVFLNEKILAKKNNYSPDPEDEYSLIQTSVVDIFDRNGSKISSLANNPSEEDILMAVYKGVEVEKIEGAYQLFQLTKDNQTAIVDFSSDIRYAYEETPFGYYVDSTFLISGDSDMDYVDPGSWKENMIGNAHFLDQNLNVIDLEVTSYYGVEEVAGRSDLYLVRYADDARPELMAIISADGKIAVEACDYTIEGNTLKYSPCSEEGFGGPLFDDNGNQIYKTIELKP